MSAPGAAALATSWELDPAVTAASAMVGALYLAGALRARRRPGPGWPWRRTAMFAAGLVAIVVSLESGLGVYDDTLLSAHALGHLGLAIVAAPLLVAGAPVTLALRSLHGPRRRALAALVRSRVAGALGRPLVAWTMFAAAMLASHLTGFYELAVRDDAVHYLEHAIYLATALLFWMPIVRADPTPHALGLPGRALYLLTSMPPMAYVGAWLASSGSVRYPAYLAPARAFGISALADQRTAGTIMLIGGTFVMGLITLWLVCRGLLHDERRALLVEAYAERAPERAVAP